MKKLLKLFFILVIMIAFSLNLSVFAADEQEATSAESDTSISTTATENTETNTSTTKKATVNNATKVSSTTEEKKLSISDILNILLIATGIVIILLAVAIFIKLK